MKSRVFSKKPHRDIIVKALNLIGLKELDDYNTMFFIFNIEKLNTIDKFKDIENDIKKYYIPSVAKLYFNETYEIKTIITIIRQLLKIKNRNLKLIKQKNQKTKKTETFYKLIKIDPNKEDDDYTIIFD